MLPDGAEGISNPVVSVVIPAFNEENNIGDVLFRTHETLNALKLPFEILVVDDGSEDNTAQLAQRYKATTLRNGKNQGKGHALSRGIKHARGDIIVTMDADGSHRPEDLLKLLTPIKNGADIVFGSRFMQAYEKNATKKLHILGNKLFNLLIQIITRKKITDSQTGYRAYKRTLLKDIEITSKGYEVDTELAMKCLSNGCHVQEEPIYYESRKNGHSHLNPLFDGFKILKTILVSRIATGKRITNHGEN